MTDRQPSVKPRVPALIGCGLAAIYLAEALCVYAGAPALTGVHGWIAAGLYGLLIVLFHLTAWPVIALPFSVMGAALFGVPPMISAPLFLLPSIYGFFFVRDYRRQTFLLSSRYRQMMLARGA